MGTDKTAFVEVVLPEVTSPEVTWLEMTLPEAALTRSDRVRVRNRFPCFFLTIVVVQNVSLRTTDRAIGSAPKGVPLGVSMRNRKLRNIRPSGAFWPEVTSSPVVTEGHPKGWKGVHMYNRKLRNIRPSGAFWSEITSSPIGLPWKLGLFTRTSASYI